MDFVFLILIVLGAPLYMVIQEYQRRRKKRAHDHYKQTRIINKPD